MRKRSVEFDKWWYIGLATVARIYRLGFRMRFDGLRNLPARGGAIVASNHVSVLDPIGIALMTARCGRTIRFLTAAEFFQVPVWGWGLRVMKQIPIRRGVRDLSALGELTATLEEGRLAGIFPEGRITLGEPPLKGQSGVTRVAAATGVPVVPVAIWGTQLRWPRPGLKFSRPFRLPLGVAIGTPIPVPRSVLGSKADMKNTTKEIMAAVEALVPRARQVATRRPR